MRLYGISDLHLPGGGTKAMDVFGPHWHAHFDKIRQDWTARVQPGDVILLPGDFSWAMKLSDALPDLYALGDLPGTKIILRGNHDYWWSALTQVRAALPSSIKALQNDAVILDGLAVAGSRGWSYPEQCTPTFADDDRIYKRELIRLDMSIADARRKAPSLPLVIMTHFPPFSDRRDPSPITALIERSGAALAVYGHLHGEEGFAPTAPYTLNSIPYYLLSCDGLSFRLRDLGEW